MHWMHCGVVHFVHCLSLASGHKNRQARNEKGTLKGLTVKNCESKNCERHQDRQKWFAELVCKVNVRLHIMSAGWHFSHKRTAMQRHRRPRYLVLMIQSGSEPQIHIALMFALACRVVSVFLDSIRLSTHKHGMVRKGKHQRQAQASCKRPFNREHLA